MAEFSSIRINPHTVEAGRPRIGIRRGLAVQQSEFHTVARARRHSLSLDTGLYILRYVTARASNDPPYIDVHPATADNGEVSFLAGPGVRGNRLAAPGSYILVQTQRPCSLDLAIFAARRDGSVDAQVQLQRITTNHDAIDEVTARPVVPTKSLTGLEVLAHVAHRGDILGKPGDWVCGPNMPMPIEGLSIHWPDRPPGVELNCAVTSGTGPQQRSKDVAAGNFVGTRGKFNPITGLSLELRGPNATDHLLDASALFLGAQVVSQDGSRIKLVGPTGREPLLGLRLSVAATQTQKAPLGATPLGTRSVAMHEVGRIRVYRPEFATAH